MIYTVNPDGTLDAGPFEKVAAAATHLGVTRQAVETAQRKNRPCAGKLIRDSAGPHEPWGRFTLTDTILWKETTHASIKEISKVIGKSDNVAYRALGDGSLVSARWKIGRVGK
jgi:hypothetical protein